MKKTFKTLLALILAAVMALGCISAFAAEETDKLLWDYYGSEYTYDIAGEITTGTNILTAPEDSYFFCYELNIEESGYYTVGFSDYFFDGWIGVPQETDGFTASGEADRFYYNNDDGITEFTYKLDEGKTYICFDAYTLFENKSFEVTYQGKSIESMEYGNKLLLNRDIYFYEDSCEIYADASVTFSSGNTTSFSYVCAEAPDGYKKGASTVIYTGFGENIDIEIDVMLITEIISDIEIANIESYLDTKVYYDGYEGSLPAKETVIFTFSDGSKFESIYESYIDNYIILPDGSEIYYHIYTTENSDGNITLCVESAGSDIKTYECEETKATFDENLMNFFSNEKFNLNRISRYLRQSIIALLDCDSLEELESYGFGEWIYNIQLASEYFLSLFGEITSFIRFYMG